MDKDTPSSLPPLKTDRLQALSAAAEASSALSVTSCQSIAVASTAYSSNAASRVVPFNPRVPDTVDLFNSPRKKSPPWKGCAPEVKKTEERLALSTVVWFTNKYPNTPFTSELIKITRVVETSLRLRFPKCLPIAFELLEFLAHIRSSRVLAPVIHKESLLVNEYATAMPLIWFSGIIYSQSLVMTVATRLVVYPKVTNSRPRATRPSIWFSHLPIVRHQNKEHSYQFWVVHLDGSNGKSFYRDLAGNQKPAFNTFKKSLVAFFRGNLIR